MRLMTTVGLQPGRGAGGFSQRLKAPLPRQLGGLKAQLKDAIARKMFKVPPPLDVEWAVGKKQDTLSSRTRLKAINA
jgi:hypothetical protein